MTKAPDTHSATACSPLPTLLHIWQSSWIWWFLAKCQAAPSSVSLTSHLASHTVRRQVGEVSMDSTGTGDFAMDPKQQPLQRPHPSLASIPKTHPQFQKSMIYPGLILNTPRPLPTLLTPYNSGGLIVWPVDVSKPTRAELLQSQKDCCPLGAAVATTVIPDTGPWEFSTKGIMQF